MRPVGRCSRGSGFSFCRTLVRLENVGDEILVHVHVVVHGNWCKSRVTQNPADFSDLGSLIRQPFFHLACNLFCVVHFHFLVSHAPIISDRRRLVKPNQGFFLLPMYIIGIFYPLPPPFLPPFLKFCQSSHKSLSHKDLRRCGPGPLALSPYRATPYVFPVCRRPLGGWLGWDATGRGGTHRCRPVSCVVRHCSWGYHTTPIVGRA